MDLSRTIYIENFPLDTTETTLSNLFNVFGKIKKIDLPIFGPDHPLSKISARAQTKGYAFIEFTDKQSALRACDHHNAIENILKIDNEIDQSKDKTLIRVMPKQIFLTLSNRYEEQRFHSMVNAAKLLVGHMA